MQAATAAPMVGLVAHRIDRAAVLIGTRVRGRRRRVPTAGMTPAGWASRPASLRAVRCMRAVVVAPTNLATAWHIPVYVRIVAMRA